MSVSIGLSLAFNSIDADVLANVRGATVTTTEGALELRARSSGVEALPPLDWAAFEAEECSPACSWVSPVSCASRSFSRSSS